MSLQVIVHHKEDGQTYDITANVLAVSFDEAVDESDTKFAIKAKNITKIHAFDDIEIFYNGERFINGVITNQSDALIYKYRRTTLKGTDFSVKLERRIVQESYDKSDATGGKPEEIIKNLVQKYAPELTTVNVRTTNKVIDFISFNYEPLRDCIDRVAKLAGWNWYVDADNDVHFFDRYEGTEVANTFSTSNILKDSLTLNYKVTKQTANRVWIVGARTASNEVRDEYFTADGNNRLFKIASRPHDYEIYVNDVKVDDSKVKADTPFNETDTNVEWLVNFNEKFFRKSPNHPIPANGDVIRFSYKPEIEIIDYFENPDSVAKYGLYEKAIKDRRITQKLTARQRGRAELKRNSQLLRVANFRTRDLTVKRGQLIRLYVPELDIDSTWRVTKVQTDISAPDTVNIEKTVEVEEVS
jgi:hypothetical protein